MASRSRLDRSEVSLCVKYFLFFFNFIILILSFTAVGVGIWILVIKEKKVTSFLDVLLDLSFWLVIFGGIFGIISFFGCFGPLRENITFLKIYHWCITGGILIELLFVIFVFLFYFQPDVLKDLKIYPENMFKDGIQLYPDADEDVNDFIELVQQDLIGCCGFSNDDEGYKQWGQNMYFNCSVSDDMKDLNKLACAVPESCCKYKDGEIKNLLCGAGVLNKSPSEVSNQIYTRGCLKGIGDIIAQNSLVFGIIIAVVLVVQMTTIYFAKNLIFQIKQQIRKWKYNHNR
ncbi:tetraspanin-33-like [Mytilus californianus]|uniref:TSPAN33 n=1 Tax=Mytilus coruscus TaxID=42192 RepID=A0A6J8CJ51_MYTCO|nr:tetraspanin-33-like [Mytilus californianus]CAC5395044.1 TSPAN33 [Mytilus coruscus]